MSQVTKRKWFTPALIIGILAVVFLVTQIGGPDAAAVEERLEQDYGLERVEWRGNARFQSERLVVDGRDLSEDCEVRGEWGSLDDLRIECDEDVGLNQPAE